VTSSWFLIRTGLRCTVNHTSNNCISSMYARFPGHFRFYGHLVSAPCPPEHATVPTYSIIPLTSVLTSSSHLCFGLQFISPVQVLPLNFVRIFSFSRHFKWPSQPNFLQFTTKNNCGRLNFQETQCLVL